MVNLQRITNLIFLLLLLIISCVSTNTLPDSEKIRVEAKQWSKIDGVVHYSDWKPFYATTMEHLKGFKPVLPANQTLYGGNPDIKFRATGFFHTIKESGRWWIVDPKGNATWNVAINGIRPGSSARNDKALREKFGSEENWITKTHKDIEAIGFNGSACWSEVPLVKYSNRQCSTPLCYTVILSLYSGYHRQVKKENGNKLSFSVFAPEFEEYVEKQAQKLSGDNDDPNLLGYFSDNELSFNLNILDEYLSITNHQDPHYLVANNWILEKGIHPKTLTDHDREMFLGIVAERYYKIVANAIKKNDPYHLYLGSRLHGKAKHNQYIVAAAGKYCDIISINYYGQWEPMVKHFAEWNKWADKPVIITEFYAKGDDSKMPNISGAGWRVKTQEDRGIFYENFCIKLLQMKNCVGWHWFRYMDNDPTDTTADDSNNDSNKGIVDNYYEYYQPLTGHMKELNDNRYNLIRYFDHRQ